MGLLDDAIREHLDLKRRRGADPGEVERQEQEALGPPGSGGLDAPEEDPDAPAAVAAGAEAVPAGAGDEDELAPPPEPPAEEPWLEDEVEPAPAEQATTEFAPPEAAEEAPAGEDVLEETPEFLQETPEHDRLWFEQRPPRDFDFDK
jgi:hypothetical protein